MKWTPTRIRDLRIRFGETQEEFAKRFRLSVEAVRGWEQDKGSPSGPASVILDQLKKQLAEADLVTT